MLWRATLDGQVMMESFDNTCSTEKGSGKPLKHSCIENPMNHMRRQKNMTLKDEALRLVGVQYAIGDW